MTKVLERRVVNQRLAPVRIETRGDGKKVITGYGAVFYSADDPGTEYWLWGDIAERIAPGAFDRAIAEQHDARGLFNHDPDNLLGRVSNGTMTISKDAKGMRYEIPVDEADPDHQRVVRKIERGDLTGSSFAFYPTTITWREETKDGKTYDLRIIEDLELVDTGPVTYPAYESTTAGVRSAQGQEDVRTEWQAWKEHRRQAEAEWIEIDLRMAQVLGDG
jgi:HK97 family phage prohead protease